MGDHQNVDPPSRQLPPPATPPVKQEDPSHISKHRSFSDSEDVGERPRYSVGIRTPSPRISRPSITRRTAVPPSSVYSESVARDGGKKGQKKKGQKKGKQKKGQKKKKKKGKKVGPGVPMSPAEPPPPPPEPPYRLLPPFSIGLRLMDGQTVYVEQVHLPAEPPVWEPPPPPPPPACETAKLPFALSFTLPKKRKGKKKKGKKGKKDKKGKKGKKGKLPKKGKKGKKKKPRSRTTSPSAPARPPSPPPLPYTEEELRWKLEDEQWLGKGLVVVRAESADGLTSWLQHGWTRLEVCRWRGYGPRERIATARLRLPPAMAEAALSATNKDAKLPIQVKCEGKATIRDLDNQEIGYMKLSMSLTCHGDSWVSGVPLSHRGLHKVLRSCPAEKCRAEEERRAELDCLYDVANLLHYLDQRKEHHDRPNLPITFEDIICAMC